MKKTICPRCGSDNIKWIIPQVWSKWVCNDCSYTGPAIEADGRLQKEIQDDWKVNKDKILAEEDKRAKELESGHDLSDDEFEEDREESLSDEELDKKLKELDL
jgi:hypothetical protein